MEQDSLWSRLLQLEDVAEDQEAKLDDLKDEIEQILEVVAKLNERVNVLWEE